jgi:hypothetical protein
LSFSFSASSFSFRASVDQITLNRGADACQIARSVSLGADVMYFFHDLTCNPSPICLLLFYLGKQVIVRTAALIKDLGAGLMFVRASTAV